ncbi:unnamed protein product [Schistosoma turkestanicum]|nr:unnamed protein product [Schistosoma turkestanicum]
MLKHSNTVSVYQSNETSKMSTVFTLKDLIQTIRGLFDEDQVDVNKVQTVLENFECDFSEWEKYIFFNKTGYTRNLIDEGNGKYNLLLLCWNKNEGTGVHDHAGSHCFVKIIKGQLKETIFDWPKNFDAEKSNNSFMNQSDCPLVVKSMGLMNLGEVTYMHDNIGIHRLYNPSKTETAISLHLYCPPYTETMNFDESTSIMRKVNVTCHSKFGKQII